MRRFMYLSVSVFFLSLTLLVTCPQRLYHFLCLSDQPLDRLDRLRSRRPVSQ